LRRAPQFTAKEWQSRDSVDFQGKYPHGQLMLSPQLKALEQVQRVQLETEEHPAGRRVKVRVESFDENLGWYTSGSLSLPIHQLPLLEQALSAMGAEDHSENCPDAKVIAFPGLIAPPTG
jgi:hypothetical protein